jgi:hypothetical protein
MALKDESGSETDGYVFEEIGECLLALSRGKLVLFCQSIRCVVTGPVAAMNPEIKRLKLNGAYWLTAQVGKDKQP